MLRQLVLGFACYLFIAVSANADQPKPLKILFLGDNGHHRPVERFRQLQPVLSKRGIQLQYTDRVQSLNAQTLTGYQGLIVYANIDQISAAQEKALLDFVAGGKGFVPLHCASYCFRNSNQYVALVGAQFQRHGAGVFRVSKERVAHPITSNFDSFESWDETYVHTKHNPKGRTVLEYRGGTKEKEPWTWVRTHGKGRVFYTAWGHDERTWSHPGFHNLIERGIRWAVGGDLTAMPAYKDRPRMTKLRKDLKPFKYVDAKIPFYPPGESWGTMGKPITKMQLPLAPKESMKHMVSPKGFELKLFVSEKKLGGKPICMAWDERGRLWVAITMDYPNELQPEGKGRDKILICEDTQGTGKADKITVFADKLSIPTSMVFYKGGVIVHQAPHTLYLKDTKGTGKADVRQILFTGWSTADTHAGPSNLNYGLDNWLYGIVGYSGFRGTIGGERHSFRTGFYRFKPDGSKFEFLRNTNNNSWGVGISEEGILFGSTANGNPSEYMPIGNRYYESVLGWSSQVLTGIAMSDKFEAITDKVRQVDYHGRFTAGAGHALYTARTYPKEYWNRAAFVTEPTGHLVATFILQKHGANFTSRNAWNLLASDDEWTAPIMAEVGPDGHVWVIDWYNYIVQHNPTPTGFKTGKGNAYETNLRDKKHGRIYRLVYKKSPVPKPITPHNAGPAQLVATLKHDNMLWRKHAQRLLVERGNLDVVPALLKLAGDASVDEIGLNPAVMHALWTLHGLGVLDGKHAPANAVVEAALQHQSAGVRRNAVAVLPSQPESVKAILDRKLLADADAQVRQAALLKLAELPASKEAGYAIAETLARPENLTDRWLPDAATCAAAAHDLFFMQALATNQGTIDPKIRRILAIVAEHYARGGPSKTVGTLRASLAQAKPDRVEIIVAGLARGWPRGKTAELTGKTEKALLQLFPRLPAASKSDVLKLAATWKYQGFEKYAAEVANSLFAAVKDEKQSETLRISSAKQLIEFRPEDEKLALQLLDLITPRTSPSLASGILEALGSSRVQAVGQAMAQRLAKWTPSVRQTALQVLLNRSASTRTLLQAVEKGKLRLDDLSLDQKQALLAHPDGKIRDQAKKLLAKGGGLPNPDRQKVVDELLGLTKKTGNVGLGKEVFKKHCAICHMHSGEGNKIGPDLTGMAVHPKEHLLTEILDPSRSVEGNYRVFTVETEDGRVFTGLLSSETKTAIELVDAKAKKHRILRENISELKPSPKSLMPEGFEKQLSRDDLVNLLEFLTQRGKYLPIPLGKVATVVSTQGMFFAKENRVERLVFRDWSPKTFDGVPFYLVDPQGVRVPNAILLYGPQGKIPPTMPKSVRLACNSSAKAIHLLSGVSGWGYPFGKKGSVTLIVRLHYGDGKKEDHSLRNGHHFADYIRRVDVPGSKFAFNLGGQQLRYLKIQPKRKATIKEIEFVKGPDTTAPVVMAVTLESDK